MQKPIPISISSYQLKPILILGLSLFIQVFLGAEDRIAWGKPVKGVRLGIKNAPSSATSDQDLTFTVMLQNVSDKTITLPQPGTFSLKKDLQSEDYHAAPLFPLIEKTRFSPSSVMLESAWSLGNSGVPVGQAPDKVVTLEPSKSVAWDSVRLEKYDYYGDRLPPKMNTGPTLESSPRIYLPHQVPFRKREEENRWQRGLDRSSGLPTSRLIRRAWKESN